MNSNILCIETSSDACSIVLMWQDNLYERHIIAKQKHTQLLLPLVNEVLEQASVKLNQLDAIAFGKGPGSFVGVRLAASMAQGLAYGANLKVIPISTLQICAQGVYSKYKHKRIVVVTDAHMGDLYYGDYKVDDSGLMQPITEDHSCKIEKFIIPKGEIIVVSDGSEAAAKVIDNIDLIWQPKASDMLPIAVDFYKKGNMVPAHEALPVYLRGTGCWKKRSD